jgi:hypothetical protein
MSQLPLTLAADRMYAHEHNADGTTKHSRHCLGGFGRRDKFCHRCAELTLQSTPRTGWQSGYFSKRAMQARQLQRRLF